MPTFVDLSHPLHDGMPAYPGLPSPRIDAVFDHDASRARYGDEAEFYLGRVDMPCNVGTYLDSPFHRFREGKDLSQINLAQVAGLPGVVVDASPGTDQAISIPLEPSDVRSKAVLVRTGWDRRWGGDSYWEPGPYLAPEAVDLLVAGPAALVGVDFSNVDDVDDRARPAHTKLLEAGVLIVEHMCNLDPLPASGFRLFAPVLRIVQGASFPVRVFAELT
jgi:arylformamidase